MVLNVKFEVFVIVKSSFGLSLEIFKTRFLRRDFTLLQRMFHSPPQSTWDPSNPPSFGAQRSCWHLFPSSIDVKPLQSAPFGPNVLASTPSCVHPLRGLASSLTHYPVFGSDSICNNPCPLPVERGFHTFINNTSFSSLIDVGSNRFLIYFLYKCFSISFHEWLRLYD